MLLASYSSEAKFSKSEGLDITERLEDKEIGSVAEEVESDKVMLLEKKIFRRKWTWLSCWCNWIWKRDFFTSQWKI